jgi:hypothetical protein
MPTMFHAEEFRTPPDDAKLWRYLDLSHFLWLLSQRSLYFSKLKEFEDKWEGAIPAALLEWHKRSFKEESLPPEPEQFKDLIKSMLPISYINCWHKNDVESVAMWKLYTHGKDGVAIQTTVSRLKACLHIPSWFMDIGEVIYLDHDSVAEQDSTRSALPFMVKRRSFRHESEVRVLYMSAGYWLADGHWIDKVCQTIPINIDTLIERIVASPDYPEWALASLQERVTAAGLNVTVERSDLLALPEQPANDSVASTDV